MPYSMAAGPAKKNTMAPTTHAVHPKQVKDDVMIFFPVSFRHSKVKKRQQMQGRNNDTNVATMLLVWLVGPRGCGWRLGSESMGVFIELVIGG